MPLAKTPVLWQRQAVNANELKELLKAAPFHPFSVCMASDKRYSVPHPEFAALSPAGETLVVFLPKGRGLDLLDVELIERIEVHRQPAHS